MSELGEKIQEVIEKPPSGGLDSMVAVLVAMAATLMAIGNIKDGNIVQAMSVAQQKSVGQWNYYQAKSMKQIIAENMAEQMKAQLAINGILAPGSKAELEKRIAKYESEAKRYEKEKDGIRKEAERFEALYEELNIHDDQFDMAEACFTITIAMSGITALVRKRWLLMFAAVTFCFGAALLIAGFAQSKFHPDILAKWLG